MTEQEAKDVLEAYMKCEKRKNNLVYEEKCNNDCDNCELCYEKGTVGEHKEAVEMAIKALEEIKQYRTIGTPEECRAAVEKQKPKKPIYKHYEDEDKGVPPYIKIACPNGCRIQLYPVTDKNLAHEHVYCPKCGQKLDWGGEE